MAKEKMMLIDTSKCIGCRACQIACQQWHQLPAEQTEFTGTYQNPPDFSVANLTIVRFIEVRNNGNLKWLFFKDQCRHCRTPICMLECPLKAIKQTKKGFVIITDKCNPDLCSPDPVKPCQLACPFKTAPPLGVPRYKLNNGNMLEEMTKMNKCDFCYDRWKKNLSWGPNPLKESPFKGEFARSDRPACEVACPTEAIITGNPKKIQRIARQRVTYLKANGYPNANIYPAAYETHVIWVLLEPPEVYGVTA